MRCQVAFVGILKTGMRNGARSFSSLASGATAPKEKEFASHGILESTLPAVPLPNADLFSYALKDLKKWQHKTAIECGITGRNYTYAKLLDGALKFSSLLGKFLPKDGSNHTIAFLTPNVPEYALMFFGAMSRGATVSAFNPMFTVGEIAHYLEDSDASVFVVDTLFESRADAVVEVLKKPMPIIVNGESQRGRPNVQEIINDPTAPMADPVQMMLPNPRYRKPKGEEPPKILPRKPRSLPKANRGFVTSAGRCGVRKICACCNLYIHEECIGLTKEVDPSSIAFLPYSSGTTGKPKGVRLSHAAFTNNMAICMNKYINTLNYAEGINITKCKLAGPRSGNLPYQQWTELPSVKEGFQSATLHANLLRWKENDNILGEYQERQLGLLPFFHIYGLIANLLPSAHYGGKLITMPMFDPEFFVSALKKHRMTTMQVVPTLLNFIGNCPDITKEDLIQLHSFGVGGAPVPVSAATSVKAKAPHVFFQEGYGMTESMVSHVTPCGLEKIGYCGHLLPNCRAKVVDLETGEPLSHNEKGELYIHTPCVMSGYHKNDMATKELIDEEGWIHSGDVAFYTEDGNYSVVDRIKELIKVKGYQVSPSEIEEVLREHLDIADAGVIGVPNVKFGEVPMAFIVRSNQDLTENDVHTFMKDRLVDYKQLVGGIRFVEELPKNTGGKLLRRMLKEMIEEAN